MNAHSAFPFRDFEQSHFCSLFCHFKKNSGYIAHVDSPTLAPNRIDMICIYLVPCTSPIYAMALLHVQAH